MAEVIARVRKEMQQRLEQLEAQLADVEALVAERAQIQRALATPPFAVPRRARNARPAAAAPAETAPDKPPAIVDDAVAERDETGPVALVEAAPDVADDDARGEEDLAA